MANSIPIRVIPGNTELVRDSQNGQYHLNVGFHLSFNVKDLMQTLAQMTDTDVTMSASASAPVGKGAGKGWGPGAQDADKPVPKWGGNQPEPAKATTAAHNPNLLGGPLRDSAPSAEAPGKKDISWDTPLLHVSPATPEYRKRNDATYQKSAAKYVIVR